MNYIKTLLTACAALLLIVSCNSGKSPEIVVDREALYFSDWGAPAQVVSYSTRHAVRVAEVYTPDGFDCFIDPVSKKIVVTPTGNTEGSNDDLERNETLNINAISRNGETTGVTIYLHICDEVKLDENKQYANSYIVTKPNTKYTFEANVRPDGTPLDTKSAKVLWQSNTRILDNVEFVDNQISFFVEASEEDANIVPNENGVIAAYNAKGEVIWSWHIWITNANPAQEFDTYANDVTFMKRNLGAFDNSNASNNTEKIYNSYGLYYQWGRKDPFARPQGYDCIAGAGEVLYDYNNYYFTEELFAETSASVGTMAYATANPRCFITNAACVEEGGNGIGDWLATADNTLWGDTSKNLRNDPCPYGWKVPSARDMEVLRLLDSEDQTDLDIARKRYGWWLSDGVNSYFYNACGYRRYNDGKIQNMNSHPSYPSVPEPWEGYYWTATANSDGSAMSLYFDLTTTRSQNKFYNNYPSRRANGMQVRCVKVK